MSVPESTLKILARIDALYLGEDPCAGSIRMVAYLVRQETPISRVWLRSLVRRIGLRANYKKPRITIPCEPSERFPCLVDLKQDMTADQVSANDITNQMQEGFLYLVEILDLFSRGLSRPMDFQQPWQGVLSGCPGHCTRSRPQARDPSL